MPTAMFGKLHSTVDDRLMAQQEQQYGAQDAGVRLDRKRTNQCGVR